MIQMVSPKRQPISASLRSPPWGNPRRQAAGFQAKTTSRDLEQCLVEAEELRVASELQQLHAWIPHNSCTSRQNSFSHHLPLNYSHISHAYTNYIIMIQFMTRKERLKWTGQGSTRVTYRHCQPETQIGDIWHSKTHLLQLLKCLEINK